MNTCECSAQQTRQQHATSIISKATELESEAPLFIQTQTTNMTDAGKHLCVFPCDCRKMQMAIQS